MLHIPRVVEPLLWFKTNIRYLSRLDKARLLHWLLRDPSRLWLVRALIHEVKPNLARRLDLTVLLRRGIHLFKDLPLKGPPLHKLHRIPMFFPPPPVRPSSRRDWFRLKLTIKLTQVQPWGTFDHAPAAHPASFWTHVQAADCSPNGMAAPVSCKVRVVYVRTNRVTVSPPPARTPGGRVPHPTVQRTSQSKRTIAIVEDLLPASRLTSKITFQSTKSSDH